MGAARGLPVDANGELSEGATVKVHFPKELPQISPGFYVAKSDVEMRYSEARLSSGFTGILRRTALFRLARPHGGTQRDWRAISV